MGWKERLREVISSEDDAKAGTAAVSTPAGGEPDPADPVDAPFEDVASAKLDGIAAELARTGKIKVCVLLAVNVASMRIDGLCPRCKHPFSQTRALGLPVSSIRKESAQGPIPRWADYLCDCNVAHPGTPPGEHGCGASFSLKRPEAQNDG